MLIFQPHQTVQLLVKGITNLHVHTCMQCDKLLSVSLPSILETRKILVKLMMDVPQIENNRNYVHSTHLCGTCSGLPQVNISYSASYPRQQPWYNCNVHQEISPMFPSYFNWNLHLFYLGVLQVVVNLLQLYCFFNLHVNVYSNKRLTNRIGYLNHSNHRFA